AYIPRPVAPIASVFPRVGHSCFAAGTPVRARDGLRAIETLRVGDQVLTQDTTTGALSFQPVLAALHNPPNATYRIELGDTTIVATGIHRFWKAGQGWAMARELKPGDVLRTLSGLARVIAVESDAVQPVYNLEVGRNASFFVGRRGVLVHDYSLAQPTPHPFDAADPADWRG
ncbi:MAG: Hint domain-containing protein, partial [Isosphaeraceae bacterium]|nr:Hint domain-containing protein [Isosphaeraceae bacterium]